MVRGRDRSLLNQMYKSQYIKIYIFQSNHQNLKETIENIQNVIRTNL